MIQRWCDRCGAIMPTHKDFGDDTQLHSREIPWANLKELDLCRRCKSQLPKINPFEGAWSENCAAFRAWLYSRNLCCDTCHERFLCLSKQSAAERYWKSIKPTYDNLNKTTPRFKL